MTLAAPPVPSLRCFVASAKVSLLPDTGPHPLAPFPPRGGVADERAHEPGPAEAEEDVEGVRPHSVGDGHVALALLGDDDRPSSLVLVMLFEVRTVLFYEVRGALVVLRVPLRKHLLKKQRPWRLPPRCLSG